MVVLAVLVLVAGAAGCRRPEDAPAPAAVEAVAPPAAVESGCPVPEPEVVLRLSREGDRVVLDPDPGLGPAVEVWRGALDADGLEDLVLRFPAACGGWGECPYGVYVGCAGDAWTLVLEADYAIGLEVAAEGSSDGWRDLLLTERTGAAGAEARTLRFDGRRYAPADGEGLS